MTELSKLARKALKLVQKGEWRTVNPNLINVLSEAGYIEFDLEDTGEENVFAQTYKITEHGQAYLDSWELKSWKLWAPIVCSIISTLIALGSFAVSIISLHFVQ